MLIQMVSNLGKNLIEKKIVKNWGMIEKKISFLFVISHEGKLLRVEEPSNMRKPIPIGVYVDCFSTSREKVTDTVNNTNTVFPLFDWLKNFENEKASTTYFNELENFANIIQDERIDCIAKFILSYDWKEYILNIKENSKVKEGVNGFFYVIFDNEDPLEDAEIIKKINQYVWDKVNENSTSLVDVVGNKGGRVIRKSTGVIKNGNRYVKTITSLAYKDYYYSEVPTATISTVTELYLIVAMQFLIKDATQMGDRKYILYDLDTGESVPLWFTMKKYVETYGYEVASWKDWESAKKQIQKELKGKSFGYLEFDTRSKGRISIENAKQYNSIQSEKVIDNILNYVEKTTLLITDDKIISFQGKLLSDMLETKGVSKSYNTDYYGQNCYSSLVSNVLKGDYEQIEKQICMPILLRLIERGDLERVNDYVQVTQRLTEPKMFENDEKEVESAEILLGRLLANAYYIEKANGLQEDFVLRYMRSFVVSPQRAWNIIWPEVARLIIDDEIEIRRITGIINQLNEINWGCNLKDYKIIEAFGLALQGYWRKVAKRKELEKIVLHLKDAVLNLRYLPQENISMDRNVKYVVTIEEIVKEETNE